MEKHADVAPDGNSLLSATQVRARYAGRLLGAAARALKRCLCLLKPLVVKFETEADGKKVAFTTHLTPSEVEAC